MISGTLTRIIVVIVAAVFVAGTWATTGQFEVDFLSFFSAAVLTVSIALLAWNLWLWKWPLLQRLPKVPRNINGTWEATLTSMWINPATGEGIAPKTVYVVVRQTFSHASVSLISDESKSKSSLARIVEEDGTWVLHYIYTNEPRVDLRHRSQIHHGSGVLTIIGNPVERLDGSYWTDRDSKGLLELHRHVNKMAEDFAGAKSLFD